MSKLESKVALVIPEAEELRNALRYAVVYIQYNTSGTDSDTTHVEELQKFASRLDRLIKYEEEVKNKKTFIDKLKDFFHGEW